MKIPIYTTPRIAPLKPASRPVRFGEGESSPSDQPENTSVKPEVLAVDTQPDFSPLEKATDAVFKAAKSMGLKPYAGPMDTTKLEETLATGILFTSTGWEKSTDFFKLLTEPEAKERLQRHTQTLQENVHHLLAAPTLEGVTSLVKGIEQVSDQWAGQKRIMGSHPNEVEMMALLRHRMFYDASQKAHKTQLNKSLTSISRFINYGLITTPPEVLDNWGHIGTESLGFRYFKYEAMGRESALMSQYGGEYWRGNPINETFGNGFLFTLPTSDAAAPPEKPTLLLMLHGFKLISTPEGTMIIRNSSKTFGRDLLEHPAYYTPRHFTPEELKTYDPRKDDSLKHILDPTLYTDHSPYMMPGMFDEMSPSFHKADEIFMKKFEDAGLEKPIKPIISGWAKYKAEIAAYLTSPAAKISVFDEIDTIPPKISDLKPPDATPESIVLFTSGSAGSPKPVVFFIPSYGGSLKDPKLSGEETVKPGGTIFSADTPSSFSFLASMAKSEYDPSPISAAIAAHVTKLEKYPARLHEFNGKLTRILGQLQGFNEGMSNWLLNLASRDAGGNFDGDLTSPGLPVFIDLMQCIPPEKRPALIFCNKNLPPYGGYPFEALDGTTRTKLELTDEILDEMADRVNGTWTSQQYPRSQWVRFIQGGLEYADSRLALVDRQTESDTLSPTPTEGDPPHDAP